jgi:putative restriction endonuclease
VFVVSDDPGSLTFVISVDERRFASLGSSVFDEEALVRRRYVTRLVQQRVHQESFRRRVLEAYREHCAVCRLRHDRLLEAAHILPDGHPRGEPVVTNGLALCKLHHAAFDANLLGVTPDYRVQLSEAILEEEDGPMLLHGMQGFHGRRIHVPRPARLQPSREFLEERYALFRQSC